MSHKSDGHSPQTTDDAQETESLLEKKELLKHEIEDLSAQSKEEAKNLDAETKKEHDALEQDIEKANSVITSLFAEMGKAKEQASVSAQNLVNSIRNIRLKFDNWSLYILMLSISSFIIAFLLGLSFAFLAIFLFIIGGTLSAIFLLRLLENRFENYQKIADQDIKKAIDKSSALLANPMKIRMNFQPISSKALLLIENLEKIRMNVSRYVDHTTQYYAIQEKQVRLKHFCEKIRNSINSFGISLNREATEYLETFSSHHNSEDDWVKQVSEELSKRCNIPAKILSLSYYEFVQSKNKDAIWDSILGATTCLARFQQYFARNLRLRYTIRLTRQQSQKF